MKSSGAEEQPGGGDSPLLSDDLPLSQQLNRTSWFSGNGIPRPPNGWFYTLLFEKFVPEWWLFKTCVTE
jgi:hypothetical protein